MADVVGECQELIKTHWEELANHKDTRPLNPDFDKYIQLNDLGIIRIFTVRDEGKLIGYASFVIHDNFHYKDWKYAACDIYYLNPEYRNNGIGLQMFINLESWLRSLSVKSVVMHEKIDHPHDGLFKALGFTLIERHYEKVL